MSNLWEDLYFDTAFELDRTRARLLQECHEERMRVIKLQGQRLTLLSHLVTSANLLKFSYPIAAQRMLDVAQELKDSYEAAQPPGAPAGDQASNLGLAPALLPVQAVPSCAVRIAPVHTEAGSTTRAPF